MVIDAKLKLQTRSTNPAQYQINAHEVTGTWESNTLKWSSNVPFSETIEDFQLVKNMGTYNWNITSLVKKWYTTNVNYGVMLKNDNENIIGSTEFYSCDIDQSLEGKRPIVEISYVNNAGLESYWTYHSMDVGRAGTVHVNDYNGNYVLVHNDVETTGSRLPISINHVFNNYYTATNKGYGTGWRLNIQQTIEKQTINGILYYVYIDEDGTKHYYNSTLTAPIPAESGIDLKLTINSSTALTLEDNAYNKISFSTIGTDTNTFYLKTITDKNANAMTIAYQGTNPSLVTDGAGRKTILAYDAGAILQTITDPSARVIRFGYTGTRLTTITYPDTKVTRYDYTASGNITDATNYEGYKMSLEYYLYRPYRVKAIKESNTDGTLGQKISMEYGSNATTFTDIEGRKNTFQFNNSGNTISIRDENSNVVNYGYGSTIATDKNKLKLETKLHSTTKNYLKNHNAELSNTWTSNVDGSQGQADYTAEDKYIGTKSLKITKTNTPGFNNQEQKVTLTKGKTYTLSAYIKTVEVSKINNKGAGLYISYLNNAGQAVTVEVEYRNGDNDWTRLEKFFTLPLDASSSEVTVGGTLSEETGTAYFDCFQLEDGKVANSYNLIENANFTYGAATPEAWSTEFMDANDGITTSDLATHPKGLDNNVLKITGSGTLSKKVVQTFNLSGGAGDVFFLGGWAKGNAAYSNGQSVYKISIEIKNSSGADYYHAFFNEDTPNWQYTSNTVVATRDYTSIRVFVIYYNNANAAMFDGIQLFRENGYNYECTNGNVNKYTGPEGKDASYVYSGNDLTSSKDEKQNSTTYTYDTRHNLKTLTSQKGISTAYGYDAYGNITITRLGDTPLKIQSSSTYDSAVGTEYKGFNYPKTATDPSGNISTYNYDWKKGNLTSFIDPIGNTTNYQYDSLDRLKEVTATASGINVTNTYGYTDQSGNSTDSLQTIGHNGFNYRFIYDKLGNATGVNVGSRNLVSNTYATYTDGTGTYNTSRLNQLQYGNGQKVAFDYDALDRITGKSIDGVKKFTYDYDENGNIALVTDNRDNSMTRYFYNLSDRLTGILDALGNKTNFTYDDVGNVNKVNETINGNNFNTTYNYNKDYNPIDVTYNNGNSILSYNYIDPASGVSIGRLSKTTQKVNNAEVFNTVFAYETGAPVGGNASTNILSEINNNGNKIQYVYDKNGNIKTITEAGKTISYDYNELNELIRENNQVTGNTMVYSYDVGGNITNKKIYPYTTDIVPTGTPQTVPYTYGDSEWKDLLTNYNGNELSYDQVGNLINDGTNTYTWEEGRQLASMSKAGQDINYRYNTDGIRTEKTVNDKTTKYHFVGDKVTYETDGTDSIYYTYDANNNLVSMNLNGTEYYYIRNGQSDIIGLFDSIGTQVVSYNYDTWGKLVSIGGTLKDTIGVENPYRYRGYRYDTETGLYYLQSRYYNPEMGRFINADSTEALNNLTNTQDDLLDVNLFAYCLNNPVNMIDADGQFAWALGGLYFIPGIGQALLAATLVAVAVALTVTVAYQGYKLYKKLNDKTISKEISKSPPARREKNNSRKKAYERAKKAGKSKKPRGSENHGDGNHYHPDVPNSQRTTPKGPSSHDHYYF